MYHKQNVASAKKNMYNCPPSDEISKVYLINASDCVFENDNVRIKRKYGKFKRKVIVIDNKKG